jgi:hypothetical protein
MQNPELSRLSDDLATLREAMGLPPKVRPWHVWINLVLAGLGAVLASLTAWTGVARLPSEAGSVAHAGYVGLLLAPVLVVLVVAALLARRSGNESPVARWELRRSLLVVAILAPLVVLFSAWAVWHQVSAGSVTAAVIFALGLLMLADSLGRRGGWWGAPWAVATILFGFWVPLGSYENAGVGAGVWLLLGGLASAATFVFLRRGDRGSHGNG